MLKLTMIYWQKMELIGHHQKDSVMYKVESSLHDNYKPTFCNHAFYGVKKRHKPS